MRRRTIAGALAAACLVSGNSLLGSAHAAFPGRNGLIVYTKHAFETNDQEIYTVSPDGSGRRRLTRNEKSDTSPSFSSNGGRIVWACRGNSEGNQTVREICTMRPDGTHKRRLTNNSIEDDSPSWSPSGRRIVFSRTEDPGGDPTVDIYRMRADGTGVARLTDGNGMNDLPEWSPDGNRIAFFRGDTTDWGVCIIRPDGSGERLIVPRAAYPSWSPDGHRLTFEKGERIFISRRDGSRLRPITDSSYEAYTPAWSPNGRWIVFSKNLDDLFAVRPDGSGLHRLTGRARSSASVEVGPDWQPR